jgi:glycosyltransferase involved in cell wall biosynthesis
MHLTLLTETFPPEVNGVAQTLGRWADAFRRRGHALQVVRPRQPDERGSQERVFALPLPFYREVRLDLATPGRLRRLLGEFRPDLVHVATEGPLGLAALRAAGRLAVPVVSSFHTHYDEYVGHYGMPWLRPAARTYLRWFHNQTALTLVPTVATRGLLLDLGYKNVALWPRGIDGQRFHPCHRDESLRASLGLGPADPLLLYVGRLAPEKNLLTLLDVFGRLRERAAPGARDRLRLALVGGGPLEECLRDARLPGVVMPGYQHGEALARWYASGDIFVFPSLTETFGNVVLEAQSSGLPVVAFNYPALGERVAHGEDGLLAEDPDDMAAALARLLSDAGARRRFGAAARRKAEGQGWEPIFDRLEERYREVVADATAPVFLEPLITALPGSPSAPPTPFPSRRSCASGCP